MASVAVLTEKAKNVAFLNTTPSALKELAMKVSFVDGQMGTRESRVPKKAGAFGTFFIRKNIDWLSKAKEICNSDPDARLTTHDYAMGVSYAKKAIQLGDNSPEALYILGLNAIGARRFPLTLNTIDKLLDNGHDSKAFKLYAKIFETFSYSKTDIAFEYFRAKTPAKAAEFAELSNALGQVSNAARAKA